MNLLQRLWNQVKQLFVNMTASQKVSFSILGASIIIAMTLLVVMSSGETWEKLYYSSLEGGDAANITTKLNELSIKHKYEGGFIYVLKAEKDTVVLSLGESGMTLGGPDPYEFLSKTDFSSTDYTRRLRHLHATEQQLAKIIQKYKIVQRAAVTITEMDGSPFVVFEGDQPAKAAVQVQLGFGKKLNKDQVRSIASLVSNTVKGLTPSNVILTDTNGTFYDVPSDEDAGIEGRLDLIKQYEEWLRKKVYDQFSAFLPNVHVTAHVQLNPRFMTEKLHDVIGDAAIVGGKEKTNETETSTEPGPQPIGSTIENRNENGASSSEHNRTHANSQDQPLDWDYVHREITSTPDAVEKKSISVIVPYEIAALKKGQTEFKAEEAETNVQSNTAEWTQLAMRAVGIDTMDDISIQAVSFHLPVQAEVPESFMRLFFEFAEANWYRMALLGFLAVAFSMVYLTLKRSLPDLTITETEMEQEEQQSVLPEIKLAPDDIKVEQMREKIQEKAVERPEDLADLLSRWVKKG